MFQVREEDNGCFIQEKVYMPLLRQQNLLQTKNKSQKSEDRLMKIIFLKKIRQNLERTKNEKRQKNTGNECLGAESSEYSLPETGF